MSVTRSNNDITADTMSNTITVIAIVFDSLCLEAMMFTSSDFAKLLVVEEIIDESHL